MIFEFAGQLTEDEAREVFQQLGWKITNEEEVMPLEDLYVPEDVTYH